MYFDWFKLRITFFLFIIVFVQNKIDAQWTQFTEVNSPLLDVNVNEVFAGPDSTIYASSSWSVIAIKKGKMTEVKELRAQFIRAFASDSKKQVWAAGKDGLWVKNKQNQWSLHPSNQLMPNILCMTFDKNDRLIVGTNEGVYYWNVNKFENIPFGNNKSSIDLTIHDLRLDKNGIIWISCQSGLGKMGKDLKIHWFDNLPGNQLVYQSAEDEQGNIWISMYPEKHATIFKLENNKWILPDHLPKALEQKEYGQPNSIAVHNVVLTKLGITFSTQFNGGIGWYGYSVSPDEIHRNKEKYWQASVIPNNPSHNGVSNLVQDPASDDIWVACWYTGLWRFNRNQVQSDTVAKFSHSRFPIAEKQSIECPEAVVSLQIFSSDTSLFSVFMNEHYAIRNSNLINKPFVQEVYVISSTSFYVMANTNKKIKVQVKKNEEIIKEFDWICEAGKKYQIELK